MRRRLDRRSLLQIVAGGMGGGALLIVLGPAAAQPGTGARRRRSRRRHTGLRDLDAGPTADPEGYGRGPANCLDHDPVDPANIARCPRKPLRR
ncbi:hypothetical protein [Sphingosinicella sp.]|uniref:hypothetical protein n=1 Tax=Sphingosinicella sp. TaxID=1917971 RepID=UPI0040381089